MTIAIVLSRACGNPMRTILESWLHRAASSISTDDEGQNMVEYALILVLITVVCVATLGILGDALLALWGVIEVVIGGALEI